MPFFPARQPQQLKMQIMCTGVPNQAIDQGKIIHAFLRLDLFPGDWGSARCSRADCSCEARSSPWSRGSTRWSSAPPRQVSETASRPRPVGPHPPVSSKRGAPRSEASRSGSTACAHRDKRANSPGEDGTRNHSGELGQFPMFQYRVSFISLRVCQDGPSLVASTSAAYHCFFADHGAPGSGLSRTAEDGAWKNVPVVNMRLFAGSPPAWAGRLEPVQRLGGQLRPGCPCESFLQSSPLFRPDRIRVSETKSGVPLRATTSSH